MEEVDNDKSSGVLFLDRVPDVLVEDGADLAGDAGGRRDGPTTSLS